MTHLIKYAQTIDIQLTEFHKENTTVKRLIKQNITSSSEASSCNSYLPNNI